MNTDDFSKGWCVACIAVFIIAIGYFLVCAEHQTKLMAKEYGETNQASVTHR